MTDSSSDAVITCVASANDNYIFILCGDVFSVGQVRIEETFGCSFKEINSKVDSLSVSSRSIDISWIRGTTGKNNSIIFLKNININFFLEIY